MNKTRLEQDECSNSLFLFCLCQYYTCTKQAHPHIIPLVSNFHEDNLLNFLRWWTTAWRISVIMLTEIWRKSGTYRNIKFSLEMDYLRKIHAYSDLCLKITVFSMLRLSEFCVRGKFAKDARLAVTKFKGLFLSIDHVSFTSACYEPNNLK